MLIFFSIDYILIVLCFLLYVFSNNYCFHITNVITCTKYDNNSRSNSGEIIQWPKDSKVVRSRKAKDRYITWQYPHTWLFAESCTTCKPLSLRTRSKCVLRVWKVSSSLHLKDTLQQVVVYDFVRSDRWLSFARPTFLTLMKNTLFLRL